MLHDRLETLIREIDTFKRQIDRQRRDVATLRMARRPTDAAELLLQQMLDRATHLRRERDLLKRTMPPPRRGKALGMRIGT